MHAPPAIEGLRNRTCALLLRDEREASQRQYVNENDIDVTITPLTPAPLVGWDPAAGRFSHAKSACTFAAIVAKAEGETSGRYVCRKPCACLTTWRLSTS